ncbi:MAG: hypothetical protein HOP29_01575 [Phycisphaerales bacterium]|nr:hypothetical protein [Phycisphaerales bacterium]
MTPRATGAAFGLLAFSTTVLTGLWVRNPPVLILQRAVWAMLLFCLIGLCVGWAAHVVVREHAHRREQSLFGEAEATSDQSGPSDPDDRRNSSTGPRAQPMRT